MREEKYYVKNADLMKEIVNWKETGTLTPELGKMILTIATNLSKKSNFAGYSLIWKEDMVQDASMTCIKYGKNFNPEKSNNPFAYITTICYNAFVTYIKKQKRHSVIKDKIFNSKEEYLASREIDDLEKSVDYTEFLKK